MRAAAEAAECPISRFSNRRSVRPSLQAKLEAAIKKAEEFNAAAVETDERKRKYNAADGAGDEHATPEEMEAYRSVD